MVKNIKQKKEKEEEEEEKDEAEEIVKPALGEVQHVPFQWPQLSDDELIQRSRQFFEVRILQIQWPLFEFLLNMIRAFTHGLPRERKKEKKLQF
jgi:hypothetical protein